MYHPARLRVRKAVRGTARGRRAGRNARGAISQRIAGVRAQSAVWAQGAALEECAARNARRADIPKWDKACQRRGAHTEGVVRAAGGAIMGPRCGGARELLAILAIGAVL